jgi:hypothetical protein
LTHNLNSTSVLTDCYNGSNVEIPQTSITSVTVTSANVVTVVFTGSQTGYCVVNSSAGNPILWTMTANNVSLASNSFTVKNPTFQDQTASTGNTEVIFQNGAGQGTDLVQFKNNGGSTMAEVTMGGIYAAGGIIGVDGTHGLDLASSTFVNFSSTSSYTGTVDSAIGRNAAGVLEIDNGTAGAYRDLILRNITINGTCTGSGCGGGGGGGSPPFTDATPIQMNAADNTKQLRFSLTGETTGTISVLTPQPGSYTLAGTNISNTFTQNQVMQGQVQFYNGSSGPQWSMQSAGTNQLGFRDSSSSQRAFFDATGTAIPNVSGIGAQWPSFAVQPTNATSVPLQIFGSNGSFTLTADYFDIWNQGLGTKVLDVVSTPGTGAIMGIDPGSTIGGITIAHTLSGFPATAEIGVSGGNNPFMNLEQVFGGGQVLAVSVQAVPGSGGSVATYNSSGTVVNTMNQNGLTIGQTGGSNAVSITGAWTAPGIIAFNSSTSSIALAGVFTGSSSGGAALGAQNTNSGGYEISLSNPGNSGFIFLHVLNSAPTIGGPCGSTTILALNSQSGAPAGSRGFWCTSGVWSSAF